MGEIRSISPHTSSHFGSRLSKEHHLFPPSFFLFLSSSTSLPLTPTTIMSLDSLAILRKNASKELAQLAEDHLKNDLQQSDRDVLKTAARKFSTWTTVGSAVGLGLGIALAIRVRRVRADMFK